jgi:hypothetical protein
MTPDETGVCGRATFEAWEPMIYPSLNPALVLGQVR